MKNGFRFLAAGVACVILLIATAIVRGSNQPTYQQKPIRYWARLLIADPKLGPELVPKIGKPLVPWFIREIEDYPRQSERWYEYQMRVYLSLPEQWRQHLFLPVPAAERRLNAIKMLELLGPQAIDAVPVLEQLLENESLSTSVLHALAAIGPGAHSAIPYVMNLLEDPTKPEPFAATTLLKIGATRAELEPLLNRLLTNAPSYRSEARLLLSFLRTNANGSSPSF